MQQFFMGQIDYIFLIYALGFFALSFGALFHYIYKREQSAWLWFALFGFLHGIKVLLDFPFLGWFGGASVVVLGLSFVCLIESARRFSAGKGITVPIYAVWFLIPFLGFLGWGLPGADVFVRYFWGAVGGFWFVVSLRSAFKEHPPDKPGVEWISRFSVCFVIYSLTQFIPPEAQFFPASFINASAFFDQLGFPVQLLRAVCIFLSVFCIWQYYFVGVRAKSRSLQAALIRYGRWIFIILFLVLVSGWVITSRLGVFAKAEGINKLLRITKTAAAFIDPQKCAALKGVREDESLPEFRRLREQQVLLMQSFKGTDIRWTYLMMMKNGQVVFTVDSVPENEFGHVVSGTPYEQVPEMLHDVFKNKGNVVFGPYKDEWGEFLSAFVSIIHPRTQEVVAVFGVDINANEWSVRISRYRFIGICLTFFLVVILWGAFFIRFRDLESREKIDQEQRSLRAIFDLVQVGVLLVDSQFRAVRANNAFYAITKQEQTSGASHDLGHVLGCEVARQSPQVGGTGEACLLCPVRKLARAVLKTGEPVTNVEVNLTVVDAGGVKHSIWLEMNASRFEIDHQVHVLFSFAEITSRKQSEVVLQESEKRFMDVLYLARDAILLIEADRFVDCNEATASMLGYASREEFLMTHPSQLSPPVQPDGQSSFEKANEMMAIAHGKGFHRFEWMHRKANGEVFPVEVSLTSIVMHGRNVLHCVWRDNSSKARADKAMRESEAWWRSLVQEVPAVTLTFNSEGIITSANRPFAGIPVQDLAGRPFSNFLDVHEQGVFAGVLDQVFNKKVSVSYESRVVIGSGEVVWYENHVGPIDVAGHVKSAVCLSFNVTEKKIANDLLREMSQAVEHSPISVVITDHAGKIEYVNPKFTVSTGFRFDEVFGQTLRVLRRGELPQDVYALLWQTLHRGAIWQGEYQERRKDGVEFWEMVTISPVTDIDGIASHFIVLKEDITERHRAQEQRENDLTFLNDLLDAIPSPVFFKNRAGQYQRCNRAFEEYIGKPRSEIIGRNIFDLLSADMAKDHQLADEEVFRKGARHVYEGKARFADGTLHDVMMFKSVLRTSKGEDRGLVGVILDITDHKRLEKELRENEAQLMLSIEEAKRFNFQLEEAQGKLVQQEKLAAIGFLAAGVAHEINNPLGFVHGNLAALEDYVDALLKVAAFFDPLCAAIDGHDLAQAREVRLAFQKVREELEISYIVADAGKLLGQTRQGLDRIKKIVQGLRSFSRTDSGEMVMAGMNDILDGVVNIVWNEVKNKAELVKEYGELPLVLCNPQQLGQVFVNLLINAAQAIPERGRIVVRTGLEAGMAVIHVQDTGTGIPEEMMSKIFDPFFTTKEPGKGTGLGLSISYDIIKKHGGRIEVQSLAGQGTTFKVYLPVSRT